MELGDLSNWIPLQLRGSKLKPSGGGLVHTYETDAQVLAESDWVYLQVVSSMYQIHPKAWDNYDEFGAFDGRNMSRWTWEGPLHLLPGETPNCTSLVEVAYSQTTDPGSAWQEVFPGELYKLRSFKTRVTVTRPHTSYDFRITRLATRATRRAPAQRDIMAERFFNRG